MMWESNKESSSTSSWISKAKWVDWLFLFSAVLISLFPLINIFRILATTGDNNLSNDYAFFLPLIDTILSGEYDWAQFFRDTFFVSHFQPLPILVYLANAELTGWNIYYELFFVAILSVIRVMFSYQALTLLSRRQGRIFMVPALALLIFSNSQISSYEFGASAVPLGLTAFGFTLAVWGLVKFIDTPIALIIMGLGGMIASWTAASGVIAWPIFLVGMLLLGYKKLSHYISWLISAVLINLPYLYFLVIDRRPGTNAYLQSIFNPRLIANLIGRPFANGIGYTTEFIPLGEAAGWLGLVSGLVGMGLIFVGRRKLSAPAAPALMFMAFGFLCAWQTSLFRVMIAPWYTNMVMPYWIGLVGLAYVLVKSSKPDGEWRKSSWLTKNVVSWIYFGLVMVIVSGLYLSTNLTYQDKSFYLASRRPVSAACLRAYETAPTYCERFVFQWTVNRVYLEDFAWPLQKNHLSVFSQRQQWSMQGDVILGRVYVPELSNTTSQWRDGLPGIPASYTEFRHLNLLVTPTQSVAWEVKLPDSLYFAELVSAIGAGDVLGAEYKGDELTYEIFITTSSQNEVLLYSQVMNIPDGEWHDIRVPLTSYQGENITLRFAMRGASGDLINLYRYPFIDLRLESVISPAEQPITLPSNTELSGDLPQMRHDDYIFDLGEAQISGLISENEVDSTWLVQNDPNYYFTLQAPIALSDFGWLSFQISVSEDIYSRAAEIFLYFEGKNQPMSVMIPLLADGNVHTYTYPLWMLETQGNLVALRFDPVMIPSLKGDNRVMVKDLRIIHLP